MIETTCPVCNGPKKNKKSVTCSRSCANTFFRTGKNSGKHRAGVNNYRAICFLHHERRCAVCSESNVLEVHHYDHDHSNNDPTNLIPICPTHHQYLHSRYRHLVVDAVNQYHERYFEASLEQHTYDLDYYSDDSDDLLAIRH